MYFDLPLTQLKTYRPDRIEADDFDIFWHATLEKARQYPLEARYSPADYGLRTVNAYDVSFNGYGGEPIKGWLLIPSGCNEPIPCVVEYVGFGGGRGFPYNGCYGAAQDMQI